MPPKLSKVESENIALASRAKTLLQSRYGLWVIGLISFVESALLVPIVTDPFMVAYILFNKSRALAGVAMTVVTSVAGGVMAYVTAVFFTELILGYLEPETVAYFWELTAKLESGTFLLAFMGAVTPIPFTLVALAAGTIKGGLVMFIIGALVGRILRYGLVGYLTYRFGESALALARKHIILLSILIFAAVLSWLLTL